MRSELDSVILTDPQNRRRQVQRQSAFESVSRGRL